MTKRKVTKSAKARRLFEQGHSVSEVVNLVGMNYGHAWNVRRKMDGQKQEAPEPASFEELTYQITRGRQARLNDTSTILVEREPTHGPYFEKAELIQGIKFLLHSSPNWDALDADMRESLDMIVHKIGRVAFGDFEEVDHWADMAGYSELVADRLRGVVR